MYIPAQGSGGFNGHLPEQHAWGGYAAAAFAKSANSDMENGIVRKDAPPAQLYDLKADPNQTENIYKQYPGIVERMNMRLEELKGQLTKE